MTRSSLVRSSGLVVGLALAAFLVARFALRPAVAWIPYHVPLSVLLEHARQLPAAVLLTGTLAILVAVGIAAGRLAPSHPALHAGIAVAALSAASFLIVPTRAFPTTVRLASYAIQIAIAASIAALTARTTRSSDDVDAMPTRKSDR